MDEPEHWEPPLSPLAGRVILPSDQTEQLRPVMQLAQMAALQLSHVEQSA